ncbi:EamA family transporter [Amycolatopsis nigrescens]|uniref:EamA family transporter n=1 Tax=Amycolatopsis nigrescens TaxID=381445 RepID=UPI0003659A64|nr:EamA family transporter [Amycolatopsis nigrescens]
MSPRDRLLAVFVAVLWGANFLAIHVTLDHFPPLFVAAIRFALVAVPTVLFVPWPKVKARWLIGYGLGYGTLQFAFLFVAMDIGMPTGLASLVLQASAPFTVLLGAGLLRERVSPRQWLGIGIAVAGMLVITWRQAEYAALLPVALTLLGALSWALGNLSSRQARPANSLHFTLWMCAVPPLPLFALSLVTEGPASQWHALATIGSESGLNALLGLGYVVLFGTIAAPWMWTSLMRRNPAGVVAPFSLLVPVVGMTTAFVALDERPALVEIVAGVVVIGGVLLGSLRRRPPALAPEPVLAAAPPGR